MGDRDSKQAMDENWEDDKTRLLARKSSSKRSSLLRDAINAVDAALGTDRRRSREEPQEPEEILQIPDMNAVQAIEQKTSQEIIEQALLEMKTQSGPDDLIVEDVQAEPVVQNPGGQPYIQEPIHVEQQGDAPHMSHDPISAGDSNHPLQGKVDPGRTQRVRLTPKEQRPAFFQEPVVAWLVIIQGPGLGAYRPVFEGNNTIGRAQSQHVQLDYGDETISAEEQAFIRYDPQERTYLFIPNLAKTNVVSINEDKPTSAVELKSMDIISMGRTRMAFVPFCGEEFDWSDI